MENLKFAGTLAGIVVLVLLSLGFIITRMYRRSTKEMALVRTGLGGQKIIKDGGALVLPAVHECMPIHMNTLLLQVERTRSESLITADRLRVDVKVEFHVRVKPDAESIAIAAQTLGKRTQDPRQIAELVEAKFVDALRSAAATMEMKQLHEERTNFVQSVRTMLKEDLMKNGLELESVSLTGLDQTAIEYFNPNNAFDAEGLKKLAEVTQTRAKERNEIEADNRVAIQRKNLEANKISLQLKQEDEFATLEQQRLIENARTAQESDLAKERAEKTKEAQIAEINAARQAEEASVEKDRQIKLKQTDANAEVQLAEVEKNREVKLKQTLANQELEQANIEKSRVIKVKEEEAHKATAIAEQEREIAIHEKSREESEARALADGARATAVEAAERVKTIEAVEAAERAKTIAVISAQTEAEKDATRIRVMADAELAAADAQAQAKFKLAEATAREYEVEAAGKEKLNASENMLSAEQLAFRVKQNLIEQMPTMLEAMGKPIEHIDSFRVVHMNGFNGANNGEGGAEGNGTGSQESLPTQMTNALLNMKLQAPMMEEAGKILGIDLNSGMQGLMQATTFEDIDDYIGGPKAVRK